MKRENKMADITIGPDNAVIHMAGLPEEHRKYRRSCHCKRCGRMVQGATNEMVYPWIETGVDHTEYWEDMLCLECYVETGESDDQT